MGQPMKHEEVLSSEQSTFLHSLEEVLHRLSQQKVGGLFNLSTDNPLLPPEIWPGTRTLHFQHELSKLCEQLGFVVTRGLGTFKYIPPKLVLCGLQGKYLEDLTAARNLYKGRREGEPLEIADLYHFSFELGGYSAVAGEAPYLSEVAFCNGPSIGARLQALFTLNEREQIRNEIAHVRKWAAHLLPYPGIMAELPVGTTVEVLFCIMNHFTARLRQSERELTITSFLANLRDNAR